MSPPSLAARRLFANAVLRATEGRSQDVPCGLKRAEVRRLAQSLVQTLDELEALTMTRDEAISRMESLQTELELAGAAAKRPI